MATITINDIPMLGDYTHDTDIDFLKIVHGADADICVHLSQAEALGIVREHHAQMMFKAVGNASEIERDTWPVQLQAAVAITAKIATDGQQAMAMAMLVEGETLEIWAAKVLAKNAAMQQLIGVAQGIKRRAEKAIESAPDSATIDTALAQAKQEAMAAMQQFVQ